MDQVEYYFDITLDKPLYNIKIIFWLTDFVRYYKNKNSMYALYILRF